MHRSGLIALFIGIVVISTALAEAPPEGTNAPPAFDPDKYLAEKNSAIHQSSPSATNAPPTGSFGQSDRLAPAPTDLAPTDPVAQYKLGDAYSLGIGLPMDAQETVKWYRKSADQGYGPAQFNLGLAYASGYGVSKDETEAVKWWRKAAEQGYAIAEYELGLAYETGHGLPKDLNLAFVWYQKAAKQGFASAENNLGIMYLDGEGFSKDVDQALRWIRQAADQGLPNAQFLLGKEYAQGEGVDKDYKEAESWLTKAANKGYPLAEDYLGRMLIYNKELNGNEQDGISWFLKAANQGNVEAESDLGYFYTHVNSQYKNVPEGLKWYTKAAEANDVNSQIELAQIYRDGGIEIYDGKVFTCDNSVAKDPNEAVKWYTKAADQGNSVAAENLACIYSDGEGVPKDGLAAVKWYRKVLLKGDSNATKVAYFDLELLYENGDCVPKDEIEALAWGYLAQASGNQMSSTSELESRLGPQASLIAQQRSKELSAELDKEKGEQSNALDITSGNTTTANGQNQPKAFGSGVFISADGLFLTAAHVVEGSTSVQVITQKGTLNAKIIQMDRANDVALLKCDGTFVPVTVKPSGGVKLGQTVFTLGYPDIQIQGLSPKMTKGEISSLAGLQDDPHEWQISVPVQPGNSGGPLFDEQGNLIGLIEAKLDAVAMARATGDVPQNVNYAVKSAYVMPMLDPYASELPKPSSSPEVPQKLEDVVSQTTQSIGLVLVY